MTRGAAATVSKPRLLIDTDIVLDVLLDRKPWADDATTLLDAIAKDRAVGYVASHAVTTVHYVVRRGRSQATATPAVSDLLQVVTVVPLGNPDFQRALSLGVKDYEDAVQVAACLQIGADYLVTRNARDDRGAPVATRTAGEVLGLLGAAGVE